ACRGQVEPEHGDVRRSTEPLEPAQQDQHRAAALVAGRVARGLPVVAPVTEGLRSDLEGEDGRQDDDPGDFQKQKRAVARPASGARCDCCHGLPAPPVHEPDTAKGGPTGPPSENIPPGADQPSRWATPSRSSSSSARVLSIALRLNSSISRPCTRLYSPFWVVTGTP